jgi:hypothetical protein
LTPATLANTMSIDPEVILAYAEKYKKEVALGAAATLGIVVLNKLFGTDPLGRTKELLGKFAVQESKRNIKVDDFITTYNDLHDDGKVDLDKRNMSYATLVNAYYELATLFCK